MNRYFSKWCARGLLLALILQSNGVVASKLTSTFSPFFNVDYNPFEALTQLEVSPEKVQSKAGPTLSTKMLGALVLGELPYECTPIVTKNEIMELQVDYVLDTLDNTTTGFGYWALKKMTVPIADQWEIKRRQGMIKQFTEDEALTRKVKGLLSRIKRAEKEILNYWNIHEWKRAGSLLGRAEWLYYHNLPLRGVNNMLNTNKWALDAVAAFDGIMAFKNLAFILGAETVVTEWTDHKREGKSFNFLKTLARAATSPARDFNFWSSANKFRGREYDKTIYSYWERMKYGTLYDKWKVNAEWANNHPNGPLDLGLGKWYIHTAIVKAIENNSFWRWFFRANAFAGMALWTAFKAHLLYTGIRSAYFSLKNLYQTANDLQTHMVTIRRGLCAMNELDRLMKQVRSSHSDPCFMDISTYSPEVQKLFELLEKDTFKQPNLKVYSRGNVLLAHRLLTEHKNELIPLFRSIGEVDAYVSMADLYKRSQQTDAQFNFVEFVDQQAPFIEITNGWVPLISQDKVVSNSIAIGADHPRGVIITGPNGGGKSGALKMIGSTAFFALSWGMAPAERVRMTYLDILRTSFNPGEKMTDDMSRFMAQKDSIDEISQMVFFASPDEKIMILGDETFTGTVEAVSANLTYDFAKGMIHQPNALTVLATHVEKPIRLADEYPARCANYQVEIVRLPAGGFARTYRLKEGPAKWWFDDAQLRDEYVPWLGDAIKALKRSKQAKARRCH